MKVDITSRELTLLAERLEAEAMSVRTIGLGIPLHTVKRYEYLATAGGIQLRAAEVRNWVLDAQAIEAGEASQGESGRVYGGAERQADLQLEPDSDTRWKERHGDV